MRLFLALPGTLVLSGLLLADIVPTPGTQPVKPVFDQADVVCSCAVESLNVLDEHRLERGGKPLIQRHISAKVQVRDSYKTDVNMGVPLYVEFDEELPTMRASMPTLSTGETGILLLKIIAPSVYGFADPFLGVTPFASIPQQRGSLGLSKLQSALAGILHGGNRNDRINALRLLQGIDELSETTLAQVTPLSVSADPEVALSAVAVLLKTRSTDSVDRLENYLAAYIGEAPVALLSIGTELGQVRDPKALPGLEALASSKYLPIKFGAMDAIRGIKDPQSVPVLIRRLDDSNSNIQYIAVITLAEILGKEGDYAPAMYLFDRNPGFYVNLWKTWGDQQGYSIQK